MVARHSNAGLVEAGKSLLSLKPYCKSQSVWRLPPGKSPEHLSPYYRFACDFGRPLMTTLKSADRSEPIYVCAKHANELGLSMEADANRNKLANRADQHEERGEKSIPAGSSSFVRTAQRRLVGKTQGREGRRYALPLIAILSAILSLVGILAAPKLLRKLPRIAQTPLPHANVVPPESGHLAMRPAGHSVPAGITQSPGGPPQSPEAALGGSVVHQVLPDVPQSARDTIHGTIHVILRAEVTQAGDPAHVELQIPGPSKYFAALAVEAARHWTFNPSTIAGQPVPRQWTIRFDFTREGTRGVATEDAH
jgi:TonB family protein